MKKLPKNTNRILAISGVAILLIILAFSIYGLAKDTKKQEETQTTMSMQNTDGEIKEEEINIEKLEEYIPEEAKNQTNQMNSNSTSKSSNSTKKSSGNKYYIKVNYGANTVTIYTKDESGEYTVPVKAMICSTGTATPKSGTYTIKGKWRWLGLLGGVYGQYSTQIVGNILFHSVPYLEKSNPGSLEYWEYDKLGTSCSAGCIRLTVRDAKWIYNNVSAGTLVKFYSSSNPGPLGKPSAKKISGNTKCRNWDPTDDNANNPWKTYVEESVKEKDNKKDNNKTNSDKNTTNNKNTNTNQNKDKNKDQGTNTNTSASTSTNTNTNTNKNTNTNTNTNANMNTSTNQNTNTEIKGNTTKTNA